MYSPPRWRQCAEPLNPRRKARGIAVSKDTNHTQPDIRPRWRRASMDPFPYGDAMRPLGQFLVALSALIVQFSVTLVPEAVAVERSDAVFLVATPGRTGLFERAVILVFRNNAGSVGFTLNHPTDTSLAELFPGYPAARRVQSPVFNGGPQLRDSIYALVRS